MSGSSYKNIFRATFLFSVVRIFRILVEVIKNKVVATVLGAEGIGIMAILTNTINFIQSGAGLGISQSAVRDVSEANALGDHEKVSFAISITTKAVYYTGALGSIVTILLSPFLSLWTFGDYNYTIPYCFLASAVLFNILTEGRSAILKGTRSLKFLAMSSVLGSVIGLVAILPLYYTLGKKGIVPSLIVLAVFTFFFTELYIRKIKYNRVYIKWKEFLKASKEMTRMGVALMLVGFLGIFFDLIITVYLRHSAGLVVVGLYSAATTVVTGYFGIVLSAMTTDYYPRICAVYSNNKMIETELNRQTEVGLLIILPVAVFFVFLSPFLMKILYSDGFIRVTEYTDYAMIGIIITICSNSLGMILLAKQEVKIFSVYSFLHRLFFVPVFIILYNRFELVGLGIAYSLSAITQIIVYYSINKKKYNISLHSRIKRLLIVVLLIIVATIYVKEIKELYTRYIIGGALFTFTLIFIAMYMQKVMNINLKQLLNIKS